MQRAALALISILVGSSPVLAAGKVRLDSCQFSVTPGYTRVRQGMGVLLALSLCSTRHAPEFSYLHTTTAHPRAASRALSGLEVGHSILANDPTFPLPERDTRVLIGDRSHLARHLAPDHNLTPWHNRCGGDDLTGRRGNYSACRSRLGRGRNRLLDYSW